MITVKEAKKQNISIAGRKKQSEFVFSFITNIRDVNHIHYSNEFKGLLNNSLSIKNYSIDKFENITFTYIVLPDNWQGVNRPERKYFKRKEHKFFIDICFPDYQGFCNATKQEAMKIMAEQTLRGTEKFLSTVKDFDYPKFYTDLKALFVKEGIL